MTLLSFECIIKAIKWCCWWYAYEDVPREVACVQVQDSEMQEGYGTGDLLTLLLEAKHEDGQARIQQAGGA